MFSCLFLVVFLVSLQSRSLCGKRSGKNTYDYIVVGSGSAGSMVASELVKLFPKDEILLIEEGSFSRVNAQIDNLIGWVNVANDPNVNRGYATVAQSQLNNREIGLSRAKITGGCNSHNGNAHILADEMDFDRWGNIPGWSLDDILDIWDEIKQVSPGEKFEETNDFIQRLLFAAQETGYPYNDDYFDLRDGTQVGSTPLVLQGNVINDSYVRRGSSWTQFVEPLLPNDNLEIVVLTRVNKILFEEKGNKINAIGVEAENLGTFEKINFFGRKEIIISGGVYDTPKLLMLSGIGDCYNELNKFGINCIKHLPGVGKNLQDHFITVLEYEFVDFDDENNNDHDLTPILDELTPISRNGGSFQPGIVTVSNESRYIQLIGPIVNGGDFSVEIIGVGISDIIISQQLLSVGSVKLFDSDPNSKPIIDHNYLNDENGEDIETVLEGIKRQREFIDSTTAFDDYFTNYNIGIIEITPGRDNVNTDDEIKEYIRIAGIGGSHPTSSCKMGKEYDYYNNGDNSIVVNEKLQVIGINNLRIADASIMPKTVSANTNLMCMVIGKKAAQFIAQDWQN